MAAYKVLATGADIAGITKMVNAYWYSTRYSIDPETLEIKHPDFTPPPDVRVVKWRNGYRFERLQKV